MDELRVSIRNNLALHVRNNGKSVSADGTATKPSPPLPTTNTVSDSQNEYSDEITPPSGGRMFTLCVYKLEVFLSSPSVLPNAVRELNDGASLIFNYAKTQPPYHPFQGFWDFDLAHVLFDASRRVGKNFKILVRVVSKERKVELLEKQKEGIIMLEF